MKNEPSRFCDVIVPAVFYAALGVLVAFFLSACQTTPSSAQTWGTMTLDKASKKLVYELVTQGELAGKPVLVSPHDFYDLQSNLSLPLAILLRERMVEEMTKNGVRVLLPGVDEEQYMILQGTWIKQKEDLILNLKVTQMTSEGPETVAATSAKVPVGRIDPTFLIPDRESWARYIVRKLETKARDQNRRSVHIQTFRVSGKTGSAADFGGYLAEWLSAALAESRLFMPLDERNDMKNLTNDAIRTRGTRGIKPQPVSLTADLMDADAELKGGAWIHKKVVEIRVNISDRQGGQVSAAMADIPSSLFPEGLLQPKPEPQSTVAGVPPAPAHVPIPDSASSGITKAGLTVDLTTDRGKRQPFYHDGDLIRFVIRLNRSSQVYIFDLDSQGRATLLYPVDANGRLLKGPLPPLKGGIPLILPEDGSSYELVVSAPFGRDTVWAVASENPLTFPSDLSGDWSKSESLMKELRSQGLAGSGGYAEDQVEIVTGP